ncbi:MAG TPA: TetR/AcrR family transcriptional regulator [Thermoanaerobaculia bacterium]|nr:TetR/AcrR family transcriptional regulator [Thermoanaerobaculia bacterium]HUM30313.1 TetR/AcrR family transcriptional regulator [Thermoanaerobaculia bacterium]HXK68536.1 TetR/AcrR family transcriptional regulator [Thermoanaerobaculia bacterium]
MTPLLPETEKPWKQVRRQFIMEAVVRLLNRGEVNSLTMDRVAEEAGITKATIYSYFKDKDEMLSMAKNESMQPLKEAIQEIFSSDLSPETKLDYIATRFLSYCDRNREVLRVLHMEGLKAPSHKYRDNEYLGFIENIVHIIEEGVHRGIFRPLDPRGLAYFFVESLTGVVTYRINIGDTTPVEETARLFLEVFFHGAMPRADA